jgi:hypothetical protein
MHVCPARARDVPGRQSHRWISRARPIAPAETWSKYLVCGLSCPLPAADRICGMHKHITDFVKVTCAPGEAQTMVQLHDLLMDNHGA